MPLTRIVFPEMLVQGNYDVIANMPGIDRETLRQSIRQAVERQFGLVVEREKWTENVYLLSESQNHSRQLRPAISGEKWMSGGGEGSIVGTAQTTQNIARVFEDLLKTPVIDSTGLKGTYDYSAWSKLSEAKSPFDLAHQLGLELTEASRPIEMLVIRKIQ